MRSTTLDSSFSGPTGVGSSRAKCVRNKRKLRTDSSCGLPVSPIDVTVRETLICSGHDSTGRMNRLAWEASANGVSPLDPGVKDDGWGAISACSDFCTPSIYQEHLRLMRWFRTGEARLAYAMAIGNRGNGEVPESAFHCNGYSMEELQELREAHWDESDEAALEDLLLKNLDYVFNEVINRIISSYGYGAEEALNAVLNNGSCFGRKDVFSNILENAMYYLTSKDQDSHGRHLRFTDLKQLEKHSVAEMVCVLRQLRSHLSRGDAMWCLLMCDMNVVQASAMEDFALAPYSERSSSVVSSMPCSQQMSGPGSCSSVPASNDASFPTRPVAHVLAPSQTHLGTFVPPGYSVNSVLGVEASIMTPFDASASQGEIEKGMIAVSCDKAFLQKLEQPLCPTEISDSHFQNTSSLESAQDFTFDQGGVSSDNNIDGVALSITQSINKLQQLSLNTALTLEACALPETSGREVDCEQQVSRDSIRAQSMDTMCGAYQTTCSTVELPLLQRNAISLQSVDNAQVAGVKLEPCMEVAASTGITFEVGGHSSVTINLPSQSATDVGGSKSHLRDAITEQNDGVGAPFVSAPGTELSLAIASVVDSGADEPQDESQQRLNSRVGGGGSQFQAISGSQISGRHDSRKDEMLMKLFCRARELEAQLQDRKEWAHQKAMQAACKLNKDMSELKALRLEREEALRLKKDKQALEDSTMKKLTEMENALRKAGIQVDRANAAVRKLETENAELRAEMEAAKLSAAESDATCQEVAKREKRSMKRAQARERQKEKLLEEIADKKKKLAQLQQQLMQAKDQQHEAEVKWLQEEKAKDEAVLLAEAEKRAKEQLEAVAKRKEEILRRKAEVDFQRHRDDIKRLESELAHLKAAAEASHTTKLVSGGPGSFQTSDADSLQGLKDLNVRLLGELAELQESRREVRGERECVMCMCEEMSVVFLPCAHQVVCAKCNDLHEKQGMRDCPSCRTPIQQRICVFGVST